MAFKAYVLTLTGVPQRLSDVFGDGAGVVDQAKNIPFRQLLFDADPANANVVYVGDDNAVSATDHGFSLDPTQASQLPVSVGPFETGPVKLSDFWILGTNAQRLMVGAVPY